MVISWDWEYHRNHKKNTYETTELAKSQITFVKVVTMHEIVIWRI